TTPLPVDALSPRPSVGAGPVGTVAGFHAPSAAGFAGPPAEIGGLAGPPASCGRGVDGAGVTLPTALRAMPRPMGAGSDDGRAGAPCTGGLGIDVSLPRGAI